MRTKSVQTERIIAHPAHTAKAVVSVYSRAGAWLADLVEDVLSIDVTLSVDNFSGAAVRVRRQFGVRNNVPIMSGLFAVGARVLVACTAVPADCDYGSSMSLFDGSVDLVQWADDEEVVTLTGRGEAKARDTWIERERVYGLAQGPNATKGARVWASTMAGEGALASGELVVPSEAKRNGHYYRVTTAGTPGAAEPTWPTSSGGTVVDGTVTWTESGATSDSLGVPVATLMQQLLTDNAVPFTLRVPVDPGWQIRPYIQGRDSVWNALKALADQMGWALRWRWYAPTGAFELVLHEPQRTGGTSVRSFALDDERALSEASLSVFDIRNVVRVVYSDSSDRDANGAAKRKTLDAQDAGSVDEYGRRFMEIAESDSSNIDSGAEAQRLASAVLADLANPTMPVRYKTAVDPYFELDDLVTLPADNKRWAAPQTLAVVGLTHRISAEDTSTELALAGKPVAQTLGWHALDNRAYVADESTPTSLANGTGFSLIATNVVGGVRLDVVQGNLLKTAMARAYEIHVSQSSGFTPTPQTLKQAGVSTSCVVADLIPGRTYWAQAVPYSTGAMGEVVRGEPSAEVSFVATRATCAYYDSTSTQSHLPLNGNFEHATQDITQYPPDHWALGAGETWGPSGSVYYGVDAVRGRYIAFRAQGSTQGRLVSSPFELRRGMRQMSVYISARLPSGSTGTWIAIGVSLYSDSGLTNLVGTFERYAAASTSWVDSSWSLFDVGNPVPQNANFAVISLYRTATSSTYSIDVGDIFIQDSSFTSIQADSATLAQEIWWPATMFNWVNANASYESASFMKDSMGFVHVRGFVRNTGGSTTVFTLPTGYRPAGIHPVSTIGDSAVAAFEVRPDGQVVQTIGSAASYLVLNAIFDTR